MALRKHVRAAHLQVVALQCPSSNSSAAVQQAYISVLLMHSVTLAQQAMFHLCTWTGLTAMQGQL